jgi:hypothetical protein
LELGLALDLEFADFLVSHVFVQVDGLFEIAIVRAILFDLDPDLLYFINITLDHQIIIPIVIKLHLRTIIAPSTLSSRAHVLKRLIVRVTAILIIIVIYALSFVHLNFALFPVQPP